MTLFKFNYHQINKYSINNLIKQQSGKCEDEESELGQLQKRLKELQENLMELFYSSLVLTSFFFGIRHIIYFKLSQLNSIN